jgi:LuxR family maltose regulon positive regulatory protein
MAEHAPAASLVEPFVPTVGREQTELVNAAATIAFIRAVLASRHGDAAGAETYARQAVGHLTADDRLLGILVRALPVEAAWIASNLPEAERLAEEAIVACQIEHQAYAATRLHYDLGQIQQASGRLRAAEQTFRRALAAIVPPGRRPMPAASLQHLGLAEVLRQRGDLDASFRHATDGLDLCRRLTSAEPVSAGFATLAWVQYAKGNHAAARSAADDAACAVPSSEIVPLFDPGPAERARLLLALGEVEAVTGWVAERGLSDRDALRYPREREYLVLARLLLARAAPDRALSLLDRLRSAAASEGRYGSLIEIGALQALAQDAASESGCALETLADALALAEPEGYVRVFADEGAPMAALLRRLVLSAQRGQMPTLSGDLLEYAIRLLSATSVERPDPPRSPVRIAGTTVLVEPLTERECEVLLLLAEGRSNREIADRLVVTPDTVKKHLTHIFGKLGAVSRTQAVARARDLRLLD